MSKALPSKWDLPPATILNPPLFIVVGKLATIGDAFLRPLERSFARHTLPPPDQITDLPRARFVVGKFLGNDGTVMGAVALVLHQHGRVANDPETRISSMIAN